MNAILLLACGITACACIVGALHPRFDDNLAQRCGMAGIALACVSIAYAGNTSPSTTALMLGLACYAAGTVFKLWRQS
jgi:hypothetical protein